jgi:5'-nucleotidase
MTLILTNDDGIDAPGLQALLKAVNGKGVIVAPQEHLSGCSHQVTTTRPIHVKHRSDLKFEDCQVRAYAIAGTPVDCVRIALSHLCQDTEFVLSGINAGANLGVDAYISGTVAAIREAAIHGIPGIAVSHYRQGRRPLDWEVAAHRTTNILAKLMAHPVEPRTFWNVNLPHLEPGAPDPEIVFCTPCRQPLPTQYRIEGEHFYYAGDYAGRDRDPGTDVDVCFSGRIAVTQIRL